jgi:hypothetical protein
MDVAALTAFLAPFLPRLLGVGGRVGDAIFEEVGDDAVLFARSLWDRLWRRVQQKEAAEEAALDVARDPADEDLQTVLKVQLSKLLAEDTDLATEVGRLWAEATSAGAPQQVRNVTASHGGVAIGGDAAGNVITTTSDTHIGSED